MTKSEYTDLINKLVSKPDEAPTLANDLVSNITADLDTLEALKNKSDDQDKKIRDLQDTNIKLFLAQTNKPDEQPDGDEDQKIDTLVDFGKQMLGGNDNGSK